MKYMITGKANFEFIVNGKLEKEAKEKAIKVIENVKLPKKCVLDYIEIVKIQKILEE